jgi:DNA-binding GntR family transcriptional regulator
LVAYHFSEPGKFFLLTLSLDTGLIRNEKFQISDAMTKIELRGIAQQVRDLIQREIEEGRLSPGERVREEVIARRLGISKTPVRLAIYELKQIGIVNVRPRQGIFVSLPSVKEVMELLEIREALEGLAAYRAALGPNETMIRRLRGALAGFDETNITEQPLKYAAADHRFHKELVRASGSDELIDSLDVINLRLHMSRLRRTAVRKTDQRPIHREHLAIIDAIEKGDAQRAADLARAHVRGVPWGALLAESGTVSQDNTSSLRTPV